ncbi:S-layer homology domain-containing protein [Paenibacillus radicis (ex Xue et al. 2023)]|uniref:S-layer homology domain-containing protein n=1 Tax=Paenibacillus radicis (ex Xue et al. 2023) TaxID=2972489 RepID=A0ABT1YAU1_9BACL|nr:S-layer homology domain-containing protein [Paenibacillus radicis (ex Xue et al. 2023)]MCR8630302.1 S-layer homology domain-containing protein [Paenibacillus radicis (ex Xue et al. 2023)]
METGLIKKMKSKLAASLAVFLLAANVVPSEMGAVDKNAVSPPASISKAVYGAVYGTDGKEIPVKASLAGTPLSWNLLTKLNNGFSTIMLAPYDTPVSKLSSDERYMAFMTLPLDDEQAAGRKLLYIQDRHTGEYLRVRTPDNSGSVIHFDMTPDARYFAFSYADNVISAKSKVYLYDRISNSLETVNGISGTNEFRLEEGDYVSISADARYIVFDTEADGLVPDDTNKERDVYLFDRLGTGNKLQRISIPKEQTWNNDSWAPTISADGTKIAFVSKAKLTDLEDYIGTDSLYLYDRNATGGQRVKRITEGNFPSMSGDGRYIAFTTDRNDLVPGDNNNKDDIYVYDNKENTFKRVSYRADGLEHTGDSGNPFISRNGAYVAYEVKTNDTRDETDIYVTNNQGLTSSKIAVSSTSTRLLSPSKKPTVGDTGNTVTFFSNYLEKIGGTEFKFFDYFVATNGTAPVWPAGSMLTASNIGSEKITLSWPQATDQDGVTGYTLYKNGNPVAYIPATQATTYTLTDQKREPDTDYLFKVEAIDSRYHRSMNGPTYTWKSDDGENPPPTGSPADIMWLGERGNNYGPLVQGSQITIYVQGAAHREAKVEWSFKKWTGDSQTSDSSSLILTESAAIPGFYTGNFTLAQNATELTALKLTLSGEGEVEVVAAEDLPVPVGGGLGIDFNGSTWEELKGSVLRIYNPESGEQSIILENTKLETIMGLWPNDEYEITLFTPDYRYEMGNLNGVRILPGRISSISLPVSLPAQVRVKVLDMEGRPVSDVPVTLWDANHNLLAMRSTTADGMTEELDGLLRDQMITAELDLKKFDYELAPGTNMNFTLDHGNNVWTVHLISPDRGNLRLTVLTPENNPVFNAYVTVSQMYKGRPVVLKARTSLDGKVRFDQLLAGEAVIEASESSYGYSSGTITTQVKNQETTSMDIPVKQPEKGVINLKVYKKALDTEWQGPLNMANENFLSRVQSKYGWISTYFSNAVTLGGGPGTPVDVCVSGSIYAFVSSCKNVILDQNSNATAEIRLEENGARVQGTVEMSRNIYYSATIYRVKENGGKEYAARANDEQFQSHPFNVNVPAGGTYRMEVIKTIKDQSLRYRYEYATIDFTLQENQIKNLGTLTFSPSSYFTNKSGNAFSAQPSQAIPGSTILLRASYRNNNDQTASNAALLLEIPEGMTLVSDSNGNKAVTGGKGPASVEGHTLRVPVGDLAKGDNGTVTYKLAVAASFNKASVSAAARIKTELDANIVEETIGTMYMDTSKVTLDAPEWLSNANMETALSGYAPAGSAVSIYDTDVRIGGAVANTSGIWKALVSLADLGSPSMHALWATTTMNNVNLQSEKVYVQYNKDGPQLARMAFSQAPAQRWVAVETGKEAPNFSYTVVPGNPFQYDFEFTNADQVENVRVYMDGQKGEPIPAMKEGNLFRAIVPTTHDALGGIYVDYDVKKTQRVYDGSLPNLDQIRAAFPPKMRDFEVISTTPFELSNGKYSGIVKLKFPQLGNTMISVTFTVDPESKYVPTEEERVLAEHSGVPAVQKSFDIAETNESLTITTGGYMPRDLLAAQLQSKGGRVMAQASAKPGDWGHTAEYFMEIKADVDGVKEHISGVKEQYEGYKGYAEKVNKIMYNVEAGGMDCIDEMPATAKQAGKALAAVVIGEVAKTALGAWTGAMALSGAGAFVAGAATGVIGDKIDNYVDQQIDAVGTGYNKCNDNPDRKKKKGRMVANPKWIYDPSGYVYEAVKSNPIEGVTATVLYLDTDNGTWKVWNAEEYDQINPQSTDSNGKYGWDVPPGKWKVIWNKGAYETQTSDELDVPPPHTEVNAGLISRTPPVVSNVTGVTYTGGSYVDITFSKYLKTSGLTEGAVVVTDASNAVLEGTFAFIKKEESAKEPGVMLSRTVRFIPKTPLTAGRVYNMKLVRSYFTSYANASMLEKDAGPHPFTVKELDAAGPVVESVKVESGGRIVRIKFNEPIQIAADAAKFQLNGIADTVGSAVAVMKQGTVETRELLLTLSDSVMEASSLKLLEGAVKDIEGNGTAAAVFSLQPDLNPNLNGLTVSNGALSPIFNPSVTSYSLQLPTGTKEVALTATAMDTNATLKIGTELAVSGLSKIVTVPEDGIITVTVKLGGGVLEKTYLIQVGYVHSAVNDLRALSVSTGILTPEFNPVTTEYSVLVTPGTTELGVTAEVADTKAKLQIGGKAVENGVANKVAIPSDRIIRVVVESESGQQKSYTIQVLYRDNNPNSGKSSGASGPSAPSVAVENMLNLSETAVREKITDSNGRTALVVEIHQAAVTEALKDGKKQKELYVEVMEQVDEVILQFPIEVLYQLEDAQALLFIKTERMNLWLDASALQIRGLAEGTKFRVVVAKGQEEQEKAAFAAAQRQNDALQKITGAVAVFAETVYGDQRTLLTLPAKNALKGQFSTVKEGLPQAVYHYDSATSSWSFVPNKKESGNGLLFGIRASGLYAVLSLSSRFVDTEGHWAKQDIDWMEQRLLVNGVSKTEFNPEGSVTRAEFAAMLVRALGIQVPVNNQTDLFSDVDRGAWYYEAVVAAASQGLVNGLKSGIFSPNETITREQMAVMISRAYSLAGLSRNSPAKQAVLEVFTDSSQIKSWAKADVEMVLQEGLMQGVKDEAFEPEGVTTRAQAVIVIGRLLKKHEVQEIQKKL